MAPGLQNRNSEDSEASSPWRRSPSPAPHWPTAPWRSLDIGKAAECCPPVRRANRGRHSRIEKNSQTANAGAFLVEGNGCQPQGTPPHRFPTHPYSSPWRQAQGTALEEINDILTSPVMGVNLSDTIKRVFEIPQEYQGASDSGPIHYKHFGCGSKVFQGQESASGFESLCRPR